MQYHVTVEQDGVLVYDEEIPAYELPTVTARYAQHSFITLDVHVEAIPQ